MWEWSFNSVVCIWLPDFGSTLGGLIPVMFNGSKASEPLTNGRGRQCMKSFGGQNRGSSEPLTNGRGIGSV